MKHLIALLILIGLMTGLAHAQAQAGASWGDGFSQEDPSQYLLYPNQVNQGVVSFETAPDLHGQRMLVAKGKTMVVLKRLPVRENTKYRLQMRSKYAGGETIEENPTLSDMLHYNPKSPVVPRRRIRFLDAENKSAGSLFHIGHPFGNWQDSQDIFYTPDGATQIEIAFLIDSPEHVLYIDDVKLAVVDDEPTINCNPVPAKLGLYNYAGYNQLAPGASMIQRDDGVVVFDTAYGSFGSPFPIDDKRPLELEIKAQINGRAAALVYIYGENNKRLDIIAYKNLKTGEVMRFNLPEGAKFGRLQFRSLLLEEANLHYAAQE